MKKHEPVLLKEVVEALAHLNNQSVVVDATLGFGGHTIELVLRDYFVIGIDTDKESIEEAAQNLKIACPTVNQEIDGSSSKVVSEKFLLVHDNFRNIKQILVENGYNTVDAIIFDLGVNLYQLTSTDRGFSFANDDAILDMRMSPETQSVQAKDLLNGLREDQLHQLFSDYLNFNQSKYLSKTIVRSRAEKNIETVGDLKLLARRVLKNDKAVDEMTLLFMALRIAVNSELDTIRETLPVSFDLLSKGGRLVVISFHSGEDRIVKEFGKTVEQDNLGKFISEKPISPSRDEVSRNPRSRSAKMRIIEKI